LTFVNIVSTMAKELSFRLARLDEAEGLAVMINMAFNNDQTTEAWSGSARKDIFDTVFVQKKITTKDSAVIVGVKDSKVIACCCVSLKSTGVGWFGPLAIDAAFQFQGYGVQMLSCAEQFCRSTWQVGEMRMDVVDGRKRLIQWYQLRGYMPTGQKIPFPYDDESRRLLQPNLSFIILSKDITHLDMTTQWD
jgi:N-acetylglutamate synthase-like GNAT family acetyltransferase